jgi:3-deoxy-D-manno-octulosonic acid kinase
LPNRPIPQGYETWQFDGGYALARADVRAAVAGALERRRSLYRWAAEAEGREHFAGRGAAYGAVLGGVRAVVRHARRGGVLASLLGDFFLGEPRFLNELEVSLKLSAAGVPTPALVAGVAYRAGPGYRADVATERVDGRDLASLFFGPEPPEGPGREAVLAAVARLVRGLHEAGFVHPDLQLRNVLAAGSPEAPQAWLLDVDTCRRSPAHDASARRANLARFYRSWRKWNRRQGERLTASDREAFESAYQSAGR